MSVFRTVSLAVLAGLALSCDSKPEPPVASVPAGDGTTKAPVVDREPEPPMPDFPTDDAPPRIALMNFRDAERLVPTDDPYAGFSTLVQAQLEADTDHEFVEREDILAGLTEIELAHLSDAGRSRVQVGKWLKADILITGTLEINAPPQDKYSGHIPGPNGTKLSTRMVRGAKPGELLKSLDLVATDLRRGAILAEYSHPLPVEFSHRVADSSAADSIAKVIATLIDQAKRAREQINSRQVVAPLYFQIEPYADGLLDAVDDEFQRTLQRTLDAEKYHVLDFRGSSGARKESELTLLGLVDVNPWAWQRLADLYVWGSIVPGKTSFKVQIKAWNGMGQPKAWFETVAYRADQSFPARELGLALERLTGQLASVERRTTRKSMQDVRRQLAADFIAPLSFRAARTAGGGREVYRKNINDWDRAIGAASTSGMTAAELKNTVRSAEAAAFFDPANRQIHEELMTALDYTKGLSMNQGIADDVFLSALRWAEHVDRFGLNTALAEGGSFKSGAKLEPYFHRWMRIWLSAHQEKSGLILTIGRNRSVQPLHRFLDHTDGWIRAGGEDMRRFIRREALARLEKVLRYASEGQIALGSGRGARSVSSSYLDRRSFPRLLEIAAHPECDIVPKERRAEISDLLDRALKMVDQLPRYIDNRRPPPPGPRRPPNPSNPPGARVSFSTTNRTEWNHYTQIGNRLATNNAPFVLSPNLPTEILLSLKIPELKIPTLNPKIESIPFPKTWKIAHILRIESDARGVPWLLLKQHGRPDGGILARMGPEGMERLDTRFHVYDFSLYQGNPYAAGRGLASLASDRATWRSIGLTENMPLAEAIRVNAGPRHLIANGHYTVWWSSRPHDTWRQIPVPPTGHSPSSQMVGVLPLVQQTDPLLWHAASSNWLRLDIRLDGRPGSLSGAAICTENTSEHAWLGSPLGLSRIELNSGRIEHRALAGRQLGIPQANPPGKGHLSVPVRGFATRFNNWWQQTLSLFALKDESDSGLSPVQPSPLHDGVTLLHQHDDRLYVASGAELLTFNTATKTWLGRVNLGSPITSLASSTNELYAAVRGHPQMLRIARSDLDGSIPDSRTNWIEELAAPADRIKAAFYAGELKLAARWIKEFPDALPEEERHLLQLIISFLLNEKLPAIQPPESGWWLLAGEDLYAALATTKDVLKNQAERERLAYDWNGNERLDAGEMVPLLREPAIAQQCRIAPELGAAFSRRILKLYDADQSGDLSVFEFQTYWLNEVKRNTHVSHLQKPFLDHDQDYNFKLSAKELAQNPNRAPVGVAPPLPSNHRVYSGRSEPVP